MSLARTLYMQTQHRIEEREDCKDFCRRQRVSLSLSHTLFLSSHFWDKQSSLLARSFGFDLLCVAQSCENAVLAVPTPLLPGTRLSKPSGVEEEDYNIYLFAMTLKRNLDGAGTEKLSTCVRID